MHPSGRPLRCVVADDEYVLADLIAMALRQEGFEATTANDGAEALRRIHSTEPDLVVLDVMMPKRDGLSVVSTLRQEGNDVPVLFLSAKDAVDDRLAGLSAGGDDYVTKPFSLEEVIMRLKIMARRYVQALAESNPELVVGDVRLNFDTHEVVCAGSPVDLTATEFELLSYLMENAHKVMSKGQILAAVWHYDFGGKASVVELYVSYLRKKLAGSEHTTIATVRGVGYMFKAV